MMLALLAAAAVCPAQTMVAPTRLRPGEMMEFRLDVLGADVGTFDVRIEAPPPAERPSATLMLRSRAKTSAFVSTNVGHYEAFATALLGNGFAPLRYKEDLDEGPVHKAVEMDFPPVNGTLKVRGTYQGNPDPFEVQATSNVRDILSALYLLRAQPFRIGQPLCVEVYAGKKIWRMDGSYVAREEIDTPLGHFKTVRMDAVAVRVDDPNVRRTAHFWVTDDERRLPLVTIGDVKGKVLRAQLTDATLLQKSRVARRR